MKTNENMMRPTHKPSAAELNQEVKDWRRRTQNIGPGRSSHKQGTERLSPYAHFSSIRPPQARQTESIHSPKALVRGDSNIKINLNFEGRAYELESDVAELRRQLRLKDRDHQLLASEYEQCKNTLERKVEQMNRKESNQNEHISQLELVVRELKARLIGKQHQQHHSPAMRFTENDIPQHFQTEPGQKLAGSALTADHSTSRMFGSGFKRSTYGDNDTMCKQQPSSQPTVVSVQQQNRYSQVRTASVMFEGGELKLRSNIGINSSDKSIQVRLATEEETAMSTLNEKLEREIKELTDKLSQFTLSNEQLKARLRQSQTDNLKITQLRGEIDKFAERLLEKEMHQATISDQLNEVQVQNQTLKELVKQQQQKVVQIQELAVLTDTLTRQNNNLRKQIIEIESHYDQQLEELEELRPIKEESSKLKSHNLQLVVQSVNEIEAIRKMAVLCATIQQNIEQLTNGLVGNKESEWQPSPAKSSIDQLSPIHQESFRMQQSFVTDGMRNHESHLEVVSELQQRLKRICESMHNLKAHQLAVADAQAKQQAQLEQLRSEVQEMTKELEQERSLTNSLLLQTKQMRKEMEQMKLSKQQGHEQQVPHKHQRRLQKCKTAIISGHESQLSAIQQHPEEQRDTDHDIRSGTARSGQYCKSKRSEMGSEQNEDRIIEKQITEPKASHHSLNRTSLLFDRSNLADPPTSPSNNAISCNHLPSRNNFKAMSFKELSYTLLSEFCDKSDQRTLFVNLMEETVCRYFELETSSIGRTVLAFLNNLYLYPNHPFLAEKAGVLLQQLKDFSISAQREVASLEQAIESYIQTVNPVFSNNGERFFEDEQGDITDGSHSQPRSIAVRSNINLSFHQRSHLQQSENKDADMSSVTELLEKGLSDTITRLRRRSAASRESIASSQSSYAPSRH